MLRKWAWVLAVSLSVGFTAAGPALCQAAKPPAPEVFLGHGVAADFRLARYAKVSEYFHRVAEASDRVNVRVLGHTTEGRPLIMAEISSPETIANLDKHRQAQRLIADPRLITSEEQARQLTTESKVVVLLNCNLHSTEIASSQLSMELLYELATEDSPRVREILEHTIVLLIPSANPDGLDKVIDWYEPSRGTPWEGRGMPWLYHVYAGHDNNRDWFMLALKESQAITRILYTEWFPTIVYDIHQMGNTSARFFVPPFHDPKNSNVNPMIDQSLLIIGGHMATELARAGKTGVVHGAMYDNWWAGGFRTTPYRHNMVGILTEAASAKIATPVFQELKSLRGSSRGLPSYSAATNFPDPWPGGWWRLRDVADYEKISCYALMQLAARYREMFQGNYIHMGREAIERGRKEAPYAWIVSADQHDPASARHMLEVLHATGIEVHQAEKPFTADGVEYPAGSFIMYCAQPYRPHLMDMMEVQHYPDRVRFPGGPAEPPYDIAGWTLRFQMGVDCQPAADAFQAEARLLKQIPAGRTPAGAVADAPHVALLPGSNDVYRLVNRLHAAEIDLSLLTADTALAGNDSLPAGAVVVHDAAAFKAQAKKLLKNIDVQLAPVRDKRVLNASTVTPLKAPRFALYQPWTASMDEGWTRLVLENFEFPYITVHNADLQAGDLRERFDCIILPSVTASSLLKGQSPKSTDPQYVGGIGDEGVAALQTFVAAGGTLVANDAACGFAIQHFKLPIKNIVQNQKTQDFYCPGSVLSIAVDNTHPLTLGMLPQSSAYFVKSQAFQIQSGSDEPAEKPESASPLGPIQAVAQYAETDLLQSGWIRGADLIAGKPAVIEAQYGDGRIVLFGFRVQHRAQPHGTFKLLFNAIARSTLAGETSRVMAD